MPTHSESATFSKEYSTLTREQKEAFVEGLGKFIDDLTAIEDGKQESFRPGLRVKGYRKEAGVFEMTWSGDGRALFEYGEERLLGKRHVNWLRVGTHNIF